MFVEKLELFGFKSFAQKTEVRLSPGFTGIVGPNGCGKSNICDAFRWVMGELNIRQIRGDSIIDVIFNGTRDVRPLGMAEVTLTVSNQDGRLPIEYDHVAIRRRVFRSGDSQFFVNRNPCRLKDIRTLFMDTGLGNFAYSVITREMMDAVLSEKDDSRRHLFEEAAGITRYKVRRRESLLKLEGTERNLTRLQDILDVEERELRSLARQVGKTRRYQKLRNQIRSLDLLRAFGRWEKLGESEAGLGDAHGEEAQRRIRLEGEVSQKEARLESLQLALIETDQGLQEKQSELDSIQEEIRGASDRILVLRERGESLGERIESLGRRLEEESRRRETSSARRSELEPRRETLEEAWKNQEEQALGAESRLSALDGKLKAAKENLARAQQRGLEGLEQEADLRSLWTKSLERRAGLRTGLAKIETQRASLKERFEALAQERDANAEVLEGIRSGKDDVHTRLLEQERRREELLSRQRESTHRRAAVAEKRAAAESQLQLLESQRRALDGHMTAVRHLLESSSEQSGIRGALGDLINVSPEWAAPLGLALGDMVSWVVVDGMKAARSAISWLEKKGQGSVTFLPLDSVGTAGELAKGSGEDTNGRWRLPADALRGPEALRPVIDFLQGRIRVADSEGDIPAPSQRDPGEIWISPSGHIHGGSGWVRAAGASVPSEEILRRGPAIDEFRTLLGRLDEELSGLSKEEEEQVRQLDGAEQEIIGLRERLEDVQRRLVVTERHQSERELEIRILEDEQGRLGEDEERIRGEHEEAQHELENLTVRREMLSRQEKRTEAEVGQLSEAVGELEEQREREQSTVSSLRLEALRREGALREVTSEAERLKNEEERLTKLLAELEEEKERSAKEKEEAHAEVERFTDSMESLVRSRESLHNDLESRRGERNRSQDELMGLEKNVRALRSDLTRTQDALRDREVHLAQLRAEKEQVRQGMLHEYQVDLAAGVPDPCPWSEEEEQLQEPERDDRLRELKLKMDQLGPVNLLAITDYDTKKERVLFLRNQKNDLESAKASLLEAIETINKRARELFLETFTQVQENFAGTFRSLFPGGEARLVLADEDPLEAGIDVQARPRGKRLESIRLLSTGEKALTATALLFALYLVKPSPFCILDEVDAPLDDSNTERFVGMLRHFSDRTQFVAITHNKITMEAADVLYGITMEEPGISKVVSVRLREAQDLSAAGAGAAVPGSGP